MTAKEMIEYLQMFPGELYISITIVDKEKRKVRHVDNLFVITDSENPSIFLEAGEEHDMDETSAEGDENG